MVLQAIAGALPELRRYPARAEPKLDAMVAFIDQILNADAGHLFSPGIWWSGLTVNRSALFVQLLQMKS